MQWPTLDDVPYWWGPWHPSGLTSPWGHLCFTHSLVCHIKPDSRLGAKSSETVPQSNSQMQVAKVLPAQFVSAAGEPFLYLSPYGRASSGGRCRWLQASLVAWSCLSATVWPTWSQGIPAPSDLQARCVPVLGLRVSQLIVIFGLAVHFYVSYWK